MIDRRRVQHWKRLAMLQSTAEDRAATRRSSIRPAVLDGFASLAMTERAASPR
jgi:hypothetical protein